MKTDAPYMSLSTGGQAASIQNIIFGILATFLAFGSIILTCLQLVHMRKARSEEREQNVGLGYVSVHISPMVHSLHETSLLIEETDLVTTQPDRDFTLCQVAAGRLTRVLTKTVQSPES